MKLDDVILVNIPRTGSMSRAKLLGLRHRHVRLSDYEDRAGKLVASFVRDPRDRLVSLWCYGHRPGPKHPDSYWGEMRRHPTFGDWVESIAERRACWFTYAMLMPQVRWLLVAGSLDVDFLGRFEQFDQDTRRLCRLVDRPFRDVRINPAKLRRGSGWRKWYTPKLELAAMQAYRVDFDAFYPDAVPEVQV